MENYIPTILCLVFLIFCLDLQIITTLQRQGRYSPDTHQTVMNRVFVWPVVRLWELVLSLKRKKVSEHNSWRPEGDLSTFKYDTTVCMNKIGQKVRLSYFFDANQHAWYMIENIDGNGVPTKSPQFEPAAVSFDVKKLQFV